MAQDDELAALKNAMSPGAWAQHQELAGAGVARDPGSLPTSAKIVYMSIGDKNRYNNSQTGQTTLRTDRDTSPFAQIQLADGKYQFVSLDEFEGKRKYLKGYTSSPQGHVELVKSGLDPETMWTVSPYQGGSMLSLDGPGDKRYLSDNGMKSELTPHPGDPWNHLFNYWISAIPSAGTNVPSIPPTPPPINITVQSYWWGFHFVVPEQLMQDWVGGGIAVAAVVDFAATFAGPASVFVQAFAYYLKGEFELARLVDNAGGNKGIYVSMSWFAPAVFVPTAIT